MKVLLDTNIIIHRENIRITNHSIGQLFYWIDKLHFEKFIHPYSIKELMSYGNQNVKDLYSIKLNSYIKMNTIAPQTEEFVNLLKNSSKTVNDKIDNQLLCEVYSNRVNILITEDRGMREKAALLGIADKVFSINSFISKATAENPELVVYKALSVREKYFGEIDLNNKFFDSFRSSYKDFDVWFNRKSEEKAYVCYGDDNDILGFLYLKTENENENYSNIFPAFQPKKRLKVGTFKVESTGFRLGERFIKIIFDNAIVRNVEEIYVTLFKNKDELIALSDLLFRWGFYQYGKKISNGEEEVVLVKDISKYNKDLSTKENYPKFAIQNKKMILPILSKYHTSLFPDSQLRTENEVDFLGTLPHRYALQKVYISWSFEKNIKSGDFVIMYRMGDKYPKKYSSVITTICIVDEIKCNFKNEEEYLDVCENRSVFTKEELRRFWNDHRNNIMIIKLIYIKSLKKRLTLEYLWKNNIVEKGKGPRPFIRVTDKQFKKILFDSETNLN